MLIPNEQIYIELTNSSYKIYSIDIHVADSILHIFETRENIDEFNKKALYILIRERTGLQTTNITRVIKTLKQIYESKFSEYEQTNFIKLPFWYLY